MPGRQCAVLARQISAALEQIAECDCCISHGLEFMVVESSILRAATDGPFCFANSVNDLSRVHFKHRGGVSLRPQVTADHLTSYRGMNRRALPVGTDDIVDT